MWNDRRVGAIELASCAGNALPDLRHHFHENAQLCLVQSGKRRAETRFGIVEVTAGECLYLPAGLPHRFTDSASAEGRCLNVYAPLDLGSYPHCLPAARLRPLVQSLALSESSLAGSERPGTQGTGPENDSLPIQALACAAGVSREHFSRTFVQQHGLPRIAIASCAASKVRVKRSLGDIRWQMSPPTASDLSFEIARRFGEESISIPFPQRDLHVKSMLAGYGPQPSSIGEV
ncbi:cupin domain-containing protein [Altericroceibacterium endophyticum]|nr:cupin domain-containing protein [Altericroceibacterium endophyticum]